MIDVSFGIPRLPDPAAPLDYAGANAIEANLYALIRAWPAFESVQVLPSIGSYGYLQLDETASPAEGVEVTFLQRLPRLMVLLSGDGLDNLAWSGAGWVQEARGLLVYTMTDANAYNANAALAQLSFSASGDTDITVTLVGESPSWEPGGLLLSGEGQTMLLFRSRATWGLAKAKLKTWDGARPLTWDEAAQLRKDDLHG